MNVPSGSRRFAFAFSTVFLTCTSVSAVPGAVTPVGEPFRTTSCLTCQQVEPSVAGGKTLFLVDWEGRAANDEAGVLGRFHKGDGNPLGADQKVSAFGDSIPESETALAAGGKPEQFVAVFRRRTSALNSDIFLRRFSAAGKPLGPPIAVSIDGPVGSTDDRWPNVAVGADGSIVVVWIAKPVPGSPGPSTTTIRMRRFSSKGVATGLPVDISTSLIGGTRPAVCVDAATTVAAWNTADVIRPFEPSKYGVVTRRFSTANAPLGPELVVANPVSEQDGVDLACSPAGGHAVAWASDGKPADGAGDILWARFDKTGKRKSKNLVANSIRPGTESTPAIAIDAKGHHLLVWRVRDEANDSHIRGRRFLANGKPDGPDFTVASREGIDGIVLWPDVAFFGTAGGAVVVWEEDRVLLRARRYLTK